MAREMMFGWREEFGYFQCAACGCVQIEHVPEDLSRHYPDDYYSYAHGSGQTRSPLWKRAIWTLAVWIFLRGGVLGAKLSRLMRVSEEIRTWGRAAGLRQSSRILEVGCGTGALLNRLAERGFTSLTGVDPFVPGDLAYGNGVRIFKRELADMQGEYDLIMIHHAFEHIPDQAGTLREFRRLLAPGGRALIRIPLSSSLAYERYGADWVQLDPPRHLFLHTKRSLEALARTEGFDVREVLYDSTGYQFWGSEQNVLDIPVRDPRSHAMNPRAAVFTPRRMAEFEAMAREANRNGTGDQACFILSARK